jgi:hypothetical protein
MFNGQEVLNRIIDNRRRPTMNKLRLWLIKKLLRPEDGYTFTGFSEGEPLRFYYKEDTNEYLLGMRCENFYYCRPGISGWCASMSRWLRWGKDTLPGTEPVEVDFTRWIHGILETLFMYRSGRKLK